MVPGWAAFGKDVSVFVQRGRHKTSLALSLIVSEGFVPNPRAFHFLEVRGWCELLWHSWAEEHQTKSSDCPHLPLSSLQPLLWGWTHLHEDQQMRPGRQSYPD